MPEPVIRRDPWRPYRVRTADPARGEEWWDGFSYGDSKFGIVPPNPEWDAEEQTWNVVHLATGRSAGAFLPTREDAEKFARVLDDRGEGIFEGDDYDTVRDRVHATEWLMVWYMTCKTLGCFVHPDSL